ncbi:hypothetical protein [Nitrosomonas sp.]|uniref:hypothetical protein n=1 Tax=Nitrosomonas sp. TaxID=42353 RepID=UPI0025DAD019|nr:hypothetical protein [Nitrosomonas sp.]MCC6917511.1 hypothetical protein [Nitrosomonas sp.]
MEIDDKATGFAIPTLKSIELVEWEPALLQFGGSAGDDLKCVIHSGKLARIGSGSTIRMLPVLDPEKAGRAFRARRLTAA